GVVVEAQVNERLEVERVRQFLPAVRRGWRADVTDVTPCFAGDHAFTEAVGDNVLAPEVPAAFLVPQEVFHDGRRDVQAAAVGFVPEDAGAGEARRDAGNDAPRDRDGRAGSVRDGFQVLSGR